MPTFGRGDANADGDRTVTDVHRSASYLERWCLACIFRREARTVSERKSRQDGPWERRRLAGIFDVRRQP